MADANTDRSSPYRSDVDCQQVIVIRRCLVNSGRIVKHRVKSDDEFDENVRL